MRKTYFLYVLILPLVIQAQMISLKTVPLAAGDQFLLYPAQNLSMGDVNIAMDDPWLDPFSNPADGSAIKQNLLFGLPLVYSIADNLGGGRTLPLAAHFRNGQWFGALMLAWQQLEMAHRPFWNDDLISFSSQTLEEQNTKRFIPNKYVTFALGKELDSGYNFGAEISYSNLQAIGGVELLYDNTSSIKQNGHAVNIKIGLTQNDEGRELKALLLYNNFDMRQDVIYHNWLWDDSQTVYRDIGRLVSNSDHTITYGGQVIYRETLPETGTTLGGVFTVNRKTHPKIPNYDLMRIPRDPGDTWAFNLGLGFAHKTDKTHLGIDFIYEPIWSNTWAAAARDTMSNGGMPIPSGGKTVNNDFTFNNWIFRFGLTRFYDRLELSGGLQIHSYSYKLEQINYLFQNRRGQAEDWWEYTWSWGVKFHFRDFNLKYSGRYIGGSGLPRIGGGFFVSPAMDMTVRSDLILAPSGPLDVSEHAIYSHQFTIEIPLGKTNKNREGSAL